MDNNWWKRGLSLYYKHFDGLWIHKLSSTHMLKKLIGFGWDDYDDWKLTSLDGTVFVAEIALDNFSWRFVPFKPRGVTVFFSVIPNSRKVSVVMVCCHSKYEQLNLQ